MSTEAQKEAREALIEQATWALIDYDTDVADRGVSDEHYRERRADVERVFPILASRAPQPTEDDREAWLNAIAEAIDDSCAGGGAGLDAGELERVSAHVADALMPRLALRGAPGEPARELAMSPEHVKETAESLHFPAEPAEVEVTEAMVERAVEFHYPLLMTGTQAEYERRYDNYGEEVRAIHQAQAKADVRAVLRAALATRGTDDEQ